MTQLCRRSETSGPPYHICLPIYARIVTLNICISAYTLLLRFGHIYTLTMWLWLAHAITTNPVLRIRHWFDTNRARTGHNRGSSAQCNARNAYTIEIYKINMQYTWRKYEYIKIVDPTPATQSTTQHSQWKQQGHYFTQWLMSNHVRIDIVVLSADIKKHQIAKPPHEQTG